MPKRPRDFNLLAPTIVLVATEGERDSDDGKNPHAVALGRLGGKKGGKARAAKLSPKRRTEIAKKAAQARYSKKS
ncbi:MAG: hypothetical protein HQ513_14610 [Rhodospirillales bacterium]|nr:hypothetical protein [Rhodospirillales bacterium]